MLFQLACSPGPVLDDEESREKLGQSSAQRTAFFGNRAIFMSVPSPLVSETHPCEKPENAAAVAVTCSKGWQLKLFLATKDSNPTWNKSLASSGRTNHQNHSAISPVSNSR